MDHEIHKLTIQTINKKFKMPNVRKENVNIVHHLDSLTLGSWNRRSQHVKEVRRVLIERNVGNLECNEEWGPKFNRRITSITWHPKQSYMYAAASKFGEIAYGCVKRPQKYSWDLKLFMKGEVKGKGAGGSITAMKFDENDSNILYRTSIDSKVMKLDLQEPSKHSVFKDFDNYERWFTAMDVNFHSNVLAAADNKGCVHLFDLNGKEQGIHKLYSSVKVHCIEFSKKDPNIFVTAALPDHSKTGAIVKIWDIRKLNLLNPLFSIPHNKAVNVASFNPVDGSKLLTSDQEDEIRVYQGPFWENSVTIKHWHRQFQHLTPIKAAWHPLHDLIVIGNYPKNPLANVGPKTKPSTVERSVSFFDAETGNHVGEIFPPQNLIISLNVFNPTGEYLASGMNQQLIIWRPSYKLEALEGKLSQNYQTEIKDISGGTRNLLRGKRSRQTREYSPVDDEEDNENEKKSPKKTKRSKKVVSASASTSSTSTSTARGSRTSTRTLNSTKIENPKKEKENK